VKINLVIIMTQDQQSCIETKAYVFVRRTICLE